MNRTEGVRPTVRVLTDEQIIGKTGQSPSGLTVGEDTSLEIIHDVNVKNIKIEST